jgi:hypothetical protein
MADDRWMWWATPPRSYPASEFTTPDEMRQERISQALGWDTTRPGEEFRNRLGLLAQLGLLAARSPHGARIGNDAVWAARAPSGVTGGNPSGKFLGNNFHSIYDSSRMLPLRAENPVTGLGFRGDTPLPPTQYNRMLQFFEEGHANRNAPASSLRTPRERGWWLDNVPGGRD